MLKFHPPQLIDLIQSNQLVGGDEKTALPLVEKTPINRI